MRKPINQSKRFAVFNRDNHTCQYCGKKAPGVVLEIDHKTPVSDGGNNAMENLVTSCFDCNRGKGAKIVRTQIDFRNPEDKARILHICAYVHFQEKGIPILPALSKQIMLDLITKFGLSTSTIMTMIASCKDPQYLFKYCLDNYYCKTDEEA